MAFECGLALGAIRYGSQTGRDFLFMCGARFQNQITLSDLSGQDARAHGDDPQSAVEAVRASLSAKNVGTRTRGPAAIWSRYDRFGTQLPRFAEKLELEPGEIRGFDFLRAYLQIVAEWIKADATRDRRR